MLDHIYLDFMLSWHHQLNSSQTLTKASTCFKPHLISSVLRSMNCSTTNPDASFGCAHLSPSAVCQVHIFTVFLCVAFVIVVFLNTLFYSLLVTRMFFILQSTSRDTSCNHLIAVLALDWITQESPVTMSLAIMLDKTGS